MKYSKTYLTGVKPTGIPHIGNYLGAIKPALKAIEEGNRNIYFIADYHALNLMRDRERLIHYSNSIAATWLALGLNPEKVMFYKQSDVAEIMELNYILACMTPKGLMNRAHAYKAKVSSNIDKNREPDADVNMGLYNYPILMAADILMFKTDRVPVGKDQVQHVEIARDIANTFNKTYGDTFNLPEYTVNKETGIIMGADGRKMSKSYNNTLEIFADEKQLRKYINKIKTDSSMPSDPKEPDNSILFNLYSQFADGEEIKEMRSYYSQGIGWGEVKRLVFEKLNQKLAEPRDKYHYYMNNTSLIDDILIHGKIQAQEIAKPFIEEIKSKIGVVTR